MTTVFYLITVWELHSSPEGQRHRRFRRRRGSRFVLPSGTLTANRRLRRHCIAWLRAKTGAPRWRHWIWIRHLTRWSIYNSAFVRILWAVRIINRGQESGTAVASVDATAIDFGGRLFCRYYCRDGKWHCHGTPRIFIGGTTAVTLQVPWPFCTEKWERSPDTPSGQRIKRTRKQRIQDITKYVNPVREPQSGIRYINIPKTGTATIRTVVIEGCCKRVSSARNKRSGERISYYPIQPWSRRPPWESLPQGKFAIYWRRM